MKTQTRIVNGTKYTFVCLEGNGRYDVIEVFASEAHLLYPKFRYERLNSVYPWQLNGKSSSESSRIMEILSEVWDSVI